jgi:hypothetical protein
MYSQLKVQYMTFTLYKCLTLSGLLSHCVLDIEIISMYALFPVLYEYNRVNRKYVEV